MSMYCYQILISHSYNTPWKELLTNQIVIPVISYIAHWGQYCSQCLVNYNKEVKHIHPCIRIRIIRIMQCKFSE
jgi:hypothetical protein